MSAQITLVTSFGPVKVCCEEVQGENFLVAMSETLGDNPVIRLHSACLFGEAFDAVDCDCGVQLRVALKAIIREGGVLVYGWHEGRGVGIRTKIEAIALEEKEAISTAEAYTRLGCSPEPRDFSSYAEALRRCLPPCPVRAFSNNPKKLEALQAAGYTIRERLNPELPMTPERRNYLTKKRAALGHLNDA